MIVSWSTHAWNTVNKHSIDLDVRLVDTVGGYRWFIDGRSMNFTFFVWGRDPF